MKVLLIIPAYNEAENIEKTVINIVLKMKELSKQNDSKIDKIVENAPRINCRR